MIEWMEGKVAHKEPTNLVFETGNIAFNINIPLSTYDKLGEIGSKEKILIHVDFNFTNEQVTLFGFKTPGERIFFRDLLLVQGIGPQTAIRMISSTSFELFKSAIVNEDDKTLASIKGIGGKRAQKLIFELKNRYKEEKIQNTIEGNAIQALIGLGIAPKKARDIVGQVSGKTLEELIKNALKKV
ncbi:MAG: Holliday junction ATP-dependent DNA helicase RuvA [bacterium]|nr:Holliday junction ATP-dependent DNA helicase RuvA [bacterium]